MFHYFTFYPLGILYLLMLFIPNLIWAQNPSASYQEMTKNENRILLILERSGQVLVTFFVLFYHPFYTLNEHLFLLLVALSGLCMFLYEWAWIRYFSKGQTLQLFYYPLSFIPLPLASLPVIGFLLLAIATGNVFLIVSVLLLGIGHIGIHQQHYSFLKEQER